jgi:hypothetical protein
MILHFDVILLILTFLISIFAYTQHHLPNYLKSFPAFLLIAVLAELTGAWLKSQHRNNTFFYNLFSVFEFVFYLFLFGKLITNGPLKKITQFIILIFPVLCMANIFLVQGVNTFHTYTFTLGSVIIDTLGICYLFQIVNETHKGNLLREPAFWIIIGLMFYHTTAMSFFGILNYVSTLPKSVTESLIRLMHFVNAVLYILFIIALVCKINIRRYIRNI